MLLLLQHSQNKNIFIISSKNTKIKFSSNLLTDTAKICMFIMFILLFLSFSQEKTMLHTQ